MDALQKLIKESKKHMVHSERKLIKPFSSLEAVLTLMQHELFESAISDDKFFSFFRKKLFWILDPNVHNQYLFFKGIEPGETNVRIIAIAHQVLLTYFEDELTMIDLMNISLKDDSYNSLHAYKINSQRGTDSKSRSN